jgi:hypothetical protein
VYICLCSWVCARKYVPSVPLRPMERPTSAALSAGPSLVPSPVTPTTSPAPPTRMKMKMRSKGQAREKEGEGERAKIDK